MNISNYKDITTFLNEAKNLVISTHSNPDGDTIGSALGLYHFLKSKKIKASMICADNAPDFLSWMPDYNQFCTYQSQPKVVEDKIASADVILHADYNAFHRAGDNLEKFFKNSKAKHLLLDHHPNPDSGFSAYISEVQACSTAQLVYNLILYMDGDGSSKIDKDAAICLYVGLITDTGSFSYGIHDEKPYLMAAGLVQSGVDDKWVHEQIYNTNSHQRLKLLGHALYNKLSVFVEEKWAYIDLEKHELAQFNYQTGDTEGFVNYALSIKGIKVAVLLTEKDDHIRLSFRSKGNIPINKLAGDFFNGGGHRNAAGGKSFYSMIETIAELKYRMKSFMSNEIL